jgi:hypothetical protein
MRLRNLLYRKFIVEKARLKGTKLAKVKSNSRANLKSLREYIRYNLISYTLIILMQIYLLQNSRKALAYP